MLLGHPDERDPSLRLRMTTGFRASDLDNQALTEHTIPLRTRKAPFLSQDWERKGGWGMVRAKTPPKAPSQPFTKRARTLPSPQRERGRG
jgi:hypothetical protein